MQSFSAFCCKGSSLMVTHADSDTMPSSLPSRRRRRKKSSDLGGSPSVGSRCLHQPHLSRISSHRFLSNYTKSWFCEANRSSLSRSFALALALEQEPVGTVDSPVGCGSTGIADDNEVKAEKVVLREMTDVRALARSLQDAKTADDVEELFKNFEDPPPLRVCSSLIRGFGLNKRLDAAFALLEWLKRKRGDGGSSPGPNLFIYNSLLGAVKQTGKFERVDEVLSDMKLQGIFPNIVTYNTLMLIYVEQGRSNDALNVMADIERNGLSPSPATYSTILLTYRKMDDASGAIGFFVKFREKYKNGELVNDKDTDWDAEYVKLEKFTIRICYLVMRQCLVKEENPAASIFELLNAIDTTQIKPDRIEFERLVWACTRESHYTVARELYRRIREMESDISLSVCNHIIWLMGKAKKWWAALEIYEDLLDRGPKPNNLSTELIMSHFNILLTAARRRGIWRWGVRLLNKMQDKGLRPGTREWNAVLVACSKASETSAAVQIFKRMVEQGEKPTILSYGALLSALEKGQLYDEALRVWDHMTKMGIKPNLHAYTILASIHAGQGKADMVDCVLREMVSLGIEPSVVTFNAIITGCAKNRMGGAALEWFNRMEVRNIKPNKITYDMLIEALAHGRKPRLAYEIYLKACNEGLTLSARSYDVVVEWCRTYGTSVDINALGPRPPEKKHAVKIRKNLSEFCDLADVPRRGKLFDNTEIYAPRMQER